MLIIAGTGHRPEKSEGELVVRNKIATSLLTSGADVVICGMASGYDLWLGDEALSQGIEVWAAKPWSGHVPRVSDKELYRRVEDEASLVVNVIESDKYPGHWVYQKRNEWMVDNATHILSYFDGGEKGGTWNCIKYARKVNKPIRNIYGD